MQVNVCKVLDMSGRAAGAAARYCFRSLSSGKPSRDYIIDIEQKRLWNEAKPRKPADWYI